MSASSSTTVAAASARGLIARYLALTKPRVVSLIVFTAIVGMFLSVPGAFPLDILLAGGAGIALAAASGAAFNHVLDDRADAIMGRTQRRPLPSGQLRPRAAVAFAVILAALSMVILNVWVNPLTAGLTFLSLIGYAVIYTVYLKHWTPQNIVIGGAAGAMPPVLGWAAVTGAISPDALLLFLIIFCWTPPHFWALALYRREEYRSAGIPMLPVTHGEAFTRLQVLLYTMLVSAVTVMPYATHLSGAIYLVGVLALNARFLLLAWRLYRDYSDALARKTFGWSIQYLALLFALLLVDHYWRF